MDMDNEPQWIRYWGADMTDSLIVVELKESVESPVSYWEVLVQKYLFS